MTSGVVVVPPEHAAANPHTRAPYSCPECGHNLRVSGLGRHRVYFELDDERADHPIMNRVCSECGHSLPGKNPW